MAYSISEKLEPTEQDRRRFRIQQPRFVLTTVQDSEPFEKNLLEAYVIDQAISTHKQKL